MLLFQWKIYEKSIFTKTYIQLIFNNFPNHPQNSVNVGTKCEGSTLCNADPTLPYGGKSVT